MATWAFACGYRLESVLKEVEARIQAEPRATLGSVEEATTYAASLPSSSADVGLASLMRMLHVTSTVISPATQHTLREKCSKIRDSFGHCYGHSHRDACQALDELENLVLGEASSPEAPRRRGGAIIGQPVSGYDDDDY